MKLWKNKLKLKPIKSYIPSIKIYSSKSDDISWQNALQYLQDKNLQRLKWRSMWSLRKRYNRRGSDTAQKLKFSIKDFFSKCDQISPLLRIWLCLLKKSLMENFIVCKLTNILETTVSQKISTKLLGSRGSASPSNQNLIKMHMLQVDFWVKGTD